MKASGHHRRSSSLDEAACIAVAAGAAAAAAAAVVHPALYAAAVTPSKVSASAPQSRGGGRPAGAAGGASEEAAHTMHLLQKPYADVHALVAFGEDIGCGVSGVIRACRNRVTGELLACKTVTKRGLKKAGHVRQLQKEVAALQALAGHPNVVRLRATVEDAESVHLIMDYCAGGDLFELVKASGPLSEADAARAFAALIGVVASCRAKGILHRDLKPENILLARSGSSTDIRVADFGIAAFVEPGEHLSSMNGTPLYVAPEVLNGRYGLEADVWSAGVVLYVLLCGVPPFWSEGGNEGLFAAIRTGRANTRDGPWRTISAAAKDLVRRLLTLDPSLRPTPEEILSHPWLLRHQPDRPATPASCQPLSECISPAAALPGMGHAAACAHALLLDGAGEKSCYGAGSCCSPSSVLQGTNSPTSVYSSASDEELANGGTAGDYWQARARAVLRPTPPAPGSSVSGGGRRWRRAMPAAS